MSHDIKLAHSLLQGNMELFYVSLLEGILILRRIVMLINVSNHSSEKLLFSYVPELFDLRREK